MGLNLERWPSWAEKAMQGLSFWIGHRHSLYSNYPLGESALVAEACNLIHANLETGQALLCEIPYKTFFTHDHWPKNFGKRARIDLVVAGELTHRSYKEHGLSAHQVLAAIEVKRSGAPKAQIDADLLRLARLKEAHPNVRAFLFLVSEARRPTRFVNDGGRAVAGNHEIFGSNSYFRVRRACKASAAFSGKETAHYACIVEVYSKAYPQEDLAE